MVESVLLIVHIVVTVTLIAVVLLQRSEGGALGIGGGGGMFSARGAGNVLTKSTVVLAMVFLLTSMGLTILHRASRAPGSILDLAPSAAEQNGGKTGHTDKEGGLNSGTILPKLPKSPTPQTPQVPVSQ
ncbi:MAG: preprotein translocase subunit SecG [Hyphomicrobiales bacterium]